MHMHTPMHMHTRVHTYTCGHIHTCIHTCTHTHEHKHNHVKEIVNDHLVEKVQNDSPAPGTRPGYVPLTGPGL